MSTGLLRVAEPPPHFREIEVRALQGAPEGGLDVLQFGDAVTLPVEVIHQFVADRLHQIGLAAGDLEIRGDALGLIADLEVRHRLGHQQPRGRLRKGS